MKNWLTMFFLLCCALAFFACSQRVVHRWEDGIPESDSNFFYVKKVISGNEIELSDGKVVRYIGIRLPTQNQSIIVKAREANAKLIRRGGGRVLLEFDKAKQDNQGYYLAYVYSPIQVGDESVCCFINLELLQNGYVVYEPSSEKMKYGSNFLIAEEIAKKKQLGIWKR